MCSALPEPAPLGVHELALRDDAIEEPLRGLEGGVEDLLGRRVAPHRLEQREPVLPREKLRRRRPRVGGATARQRRRRAPRRQPLPIPRAAWVGIQLTEYSAQLKIQLNIQRILPFSLVK